MKNNEIEVEDENREYIDANENYYEDINKEIIDNLKKKSNESLKKIEKKLYKIPQFINVVKSAVPKTELKAILNNEQAEGLKNGKLKIMKSQKGDLKAVLVNSKSKKTDSIINLEQVKEYGNISKELSNYAQQAQLANIAEQLEEISTTVNEVKTIEMNKIFALVNSNKQMYLQALHVNNPTIRNQLLLNLVSSVENSKQELMLNQGSALKYIEDNVHENSFRKFFDDDEKKDEKINELYDYFSAYNQSTFIQCLAYNELGENNVLKVCLKDYQKFVNTMYLSKNGLVERLDMLMPRSELVWSREVPKYYNEIGKITKLELNNKEMLRIEKM